MEKRSNKYHLTLSLKQYANGETEPAKELGLEFSNHDEIFGIIEKIKDKNIFDNPHEATQFAVGLKLFNEIFFNLTNYITLSIGLLLLYWGIFSNLIYPIMDMIKEPTVGVIFIGLLRIFILSAICFFSGLSFILMTFFKNK